MRIAGAAILLLFLSACSSDTDSSTTAAEPASFDQHAEGYVRLALALGEHDADYVDAYFGPPEWREQAKDEAMPLAEIEMAAQELAATIRSMPVNRDDYLQQVRQDFLASHLESLATVAAMRNGEVLSFDEESLRVYGFVAPSFPIEHYDAVLAELNALLPGDGPLHERVFAFNDRFTVPPATYESVIRAGIDACRERTLARMTLPAGEDFVLELVSGNPWSAYNWYQGAYQGLIQVESSRPLSVYAATRLGCHEGYPGHHTFSSLLEKNYLQDRGWIEFSVFPLFSPMGIIFEGSGDYAETVAFPDSDKMTFLRDVVQPIAGIDDELDYELRQQIDAVTRKARYAGVEAARKFLDGEWDRDQTTDWLTRYALMPPENIDAWFGFTDRYRAYRINYTLGKDLVEQFIREANPDADNEGDWAALATLLSYPPTPLLFAED